MVGCDFHHFKKAKSILQLIKGKVLHKTLTYKEQP